MHWTLSTMARRAACNIELLDVHDARSPLSLNCGCVWSCVNRRRVVAIACFYTSQSVPGSQHIAPSLSVSVSLSLCVCVVCVSAVEVSRDVILTSTL